MYFKTNFKVLMQDDNIGVLCKLIIHILTPKTMHVHCMCHPTCHQDYLFLFFFLLTLQDLRERIYNMSILRLPA
jgi:hypothetical protein